MQKYLFYNEFIIYLYMFRARSAHHQEVKIVLYSIWYRHTETSEWSKTNLNQSRDSVWRYQMLYIQISPPDDEHIEFETCRGI